jgi:hypothetical protein
MGWLDFLWHDHEDTNDSGHNSSFRLTNDDGISDIEVLRVSDAQIKEVQTEQGFETFQEARDWVAKLFGH